MEPVAGGSGPRPGRGTDDEDDEVVVVDVPGIGEVRVPVDLARRRRRDLQRAAFLGLALDGKPDADDIRAALEEGFGQVDELGVDDALVVLRDAVADGSLVPPRLALFDALLGNLRGPESSLLRSEGLDELLGAVVEADGDSEHGLLPDVRVSILRDGLEVARRRVDEAIEAGAVDVALVELPEFVGQTQTALNYTSAELYSNAKCDDSHTVQSKTTGKESPVVIATYDGPGEVGDYVSLLDPRNWPSCSLYFEEMLIVPEGSEVVPAAHGHGWDATFLEVVRFNGTTIHTPLRFSLRRDAELVTSEYDLVQPTKHILEDNGHLSATLRYDDASGDVLGVSVELWKTIRWASGLQDSWPHVACEIFWKSLAISMAVGCVHLPDDQHDDP